MTVGRGLGHDERVRMIAGVLAVVAGLAGSVLHAVNSAAGRGFEPSFWLVLALASIAFGSVGTMLATRSTVRRIPALMVATGLGQGLGLLCMEYAILGPMPGAPLALWLATWLWAPSLFLSATVLPLLLPDGLLASPRWRPALWAAWLVLAAHVVIWAVTPYEAQFPPIRVRDLVNPIGQQWATDPALQIGLAVATAAVVAAALASVAMRWRSSAGDARQQLKWLVFGAGAAVALFAAGAAAPQPWGELLVGAAALPVPLTAGVAALRHRLWDVDLAISIGLRYALLSASVVVVYTMVTSVWAASSSAPAVAAAVVAVVLLPLHDGLRRLVNRLVHGERDDPDTALALLGARLEATGDPVEVADALLPEVVARLAGLLRSRYVALELADGTVIRHGEAAVSERIVLRYAGREVGVLDLAARQRSRAERHRLERVAEQASVAVHSVLATREARRSRQLVVAAREEERRRLRWDLHDGVAPLLAGLALQAETARDLVDTDPGTTRVILDRLVPNLTAAVGDVRAIVHELRPPALDELGLAGAVRELAARFDRPVQRVEVIVDDVDGLSAAVDLAAYRIVAEGLNNAVRHARAARIEVRLARAEDGLVVRIADDGRGLPAVAGGGVGLDSMRARADEMGGRFDVTAAAGGGTVVTAILPLEMGDDEP